MTDLEFLYFEALKKEIQKIFLENNTPSEDEISKWKGIDIIYFQEDLRKKAKGNISEKSFYTYFKTSPVEKLPRIDMLNLLSSYVGNQSWYEFKKYHPLSIPEESTIESSPLEDQAPVLPLSKEHLDVELPQVTDGLESALHLEENTEPVPPDISSPVLPERIAENNVLQTRLSDDQYDTTNPAQKEQVQIRLDSKKKKHLKEQLWVGISLFLAIVVAVLGFKDEIFGRYFTYCFTDADRNAAIKGELEIKVIKKNESPLFYRIQPGECFYYSTKDPELKMEISSTLYENLTIDRKLDAAPKEETIELKPDDYKMAVDYFSKKNVQGETELNKKREQLERLISNDAIISQIYDSDVYGIETLSKEKYITLVTTPTTSLKNLKVIEMKRDKGKIISIKFKISNDEDK